jgi:hypothetical protein
MIKFSPIFLFLIGRQQAVIIIMGRKKKRHTHLPVLCGFLVSRMTKKRSVLNLELFPIRNYSTEKSFFLLDDMTNNNTIRELKLHSPAGVEPAVFTWPNIERQVNHPYYLEFSY